MPGAAPPLLPMDSGAPLGFGVDVGRAGEAFLFDRLISEDANEIGPLTAPLGSIEDTPSVICGAATIRVDKVEASEADEAETSGVTDGAVEVVAVTVAMDGAACG